MDPFVLLNSKLELASYQAGFLASGVPDLSSCPTRTLTKTIWGYEGGDVGQTPFGFVTTGPEGPIATFRGTEMPDGSLAEWLDNLDAFLIPCPLVPGTRVHRGMWGLYRSLNVVGCPIGSYLATVPGVRCHGHSLGAVFAVYASLEAKAALPPVLFACPKGWDGAFATHFADLYGTKVPLFRNPDDVVPALPITVDVLFVAEDFQPIAEATVLLPTSVVPRVGSSWLEAHSMANYDRLLNAA